MRNGLLDRDEEGHLLSLSGEPQMREALIFTHWETTHCPIGTVARVKAACQFLDIHGAGCPQMLTAQVYDLKRRLKKVQGVADSAIASYGLQAPR